MDVYMNDDIGGILDHLEKNDLDVDDIPSNLLYNEALHDYQTRDDDSSMSDYTEQISEVLDANNEDLQPATQAPTSHFLNVHFDEEDEDEDEKEEGSKDRGSQDEGSQDEGSISEGNEDEKDEKDEDEDEDVVVTCHNFYRHTFQITLDSGISPIAHHEIIWLPKQPGNNISLLEHQPAHFYDIKSILTKKSPNRAYPYIAVGFTSSVYEKYTKTPPGKGVKLADVDENDFIAVVPTISSNPQTRYYAIGQQGDGGIKLFSVPARLIFFLSSLSEDHPISPGKSKPTIVKDKQTAWGQYQRNVAEQALEGRSPPAQKTKVRRLKANVKFETAKFPFNEPAAIAGYVQVIMGILEANPRDSDIVIKRVVGQLKSNFNDDGVNDSRPHIAIRHFLDTTIVRNDEVCSTGEDQMAWAAWARAHEEIAITLNDYITSRDAVAAVKAVWGLILDVDDLIKLRLAVINEKRLVRYSVIGGLFFNAVKAKERDADWSAGDVVSHTIDFAGFCDFNKVTQSPPSCPDEAWKMALRALRDSLTRVYHEFRERKAAAELAIGGNPGEYDDMTEAINDLVTSPDLHSAQEAVAGMQHVSLEMTSAWAVATADSISLVVTWIDELLGE